MKRTIALISGTIIVFWSFVSFIDYLISKQVYYINGTIEKATLDDDGNIIIMEDDITDQATYLVYEYENATIGLIAVKDSDDRVLVVVNATNSCKQSPKAYFVQQDNKFICQKCSTSIKVDDLDKNLDTECYPISIKERINLNGKIIIGTNELKNLKDKFIDWKGPIDN